MSLKIILVGPVLSYDSFTNYIYVLTEKLYVYQWLFLETKFFYSGIIIIIIHPKIHLSNLFFTAVNLKSKRWVLHNKYIPRSLTKTHTNNRRSNVCNECQKDLFICCTYQHIKSWQHINIFKALVTRQNVITFEEIEQ